MNKKSGIGNKRGMKFKNNGGIQTWVHCQEKVQHNTKNIHKNKINYKNNIDNRRFKN